MTLKILKHLIVILFIVGCTNDGELYDKKKHKDSEFSAGNTLGLLLGAAIVGAAASQGGGYSRTDYDWDWDYQPSNFQWVCRGIQTGQYAELENCVYDVKDDDRWPD